METFLKDMTQMIQGKCTNYTGLVYRLYRVSVQTVQGECTDCKGLVYRRYRVSVQTVQGWCTDGTE